MGIFGDLTGDDVFGTTGTTGSTNGSGALWTDRIFGKGQDVLGQFLDLSANFALQKQKNKFELSLAKQNQMLSNTGTAQNVNATPEPLYIPQANAGASGGMDNKWLILAVVAGVALYLSK